MLCSEYGFMLGCPILEKNTGPGGWPPLRGQTGKGLAEKGKSGRLAFRFRDKKSLSSFAGEKRLFDTSHLGHWKIAGYIDGLVQMLEGKGSQGGRTSLSSTWIPPARTPSRHVEVTIARCITCLNGKANRSSSMSQIGDLKKQRGVSKPLRDHIQIHV